ncbi:hypothetical protein [Ruegeria faecimaris]|uniref:hypothetical protein n=1 Tax=Ruegeria faecimaris TaxID=686389 RepID=UPI0024916FD7|nr:hypothetical protein [Ruegeria faecimaris]
MKTSTQYSYLLGCIYDEPEEYGHLGRGTHYSVFRTVAWRDEKLDAIEKVCCQDISVIWDEDHDDRIIPCIEKLLLAGLLSPVVFIGERKGNLTLIVSSEFAAIKGQSGLEIYQRDIQAIANDLDGDVWDVRVGYYNRDSENGSLVKIGDAGIINDSEEKVATYLQNIDNLWSLGLKKLPKKHQHASAPNF